MYTFKHRTIETTKVSEKFQKLPVAVQLVDICLKYNKTLDEVVSLYEDIEKRLEVVNERKDT